MTRQLLWLVLAIGLALQWILVRASGAHPGPYLGYSLACVLLTVLLFLASRDTRVGFGRMVRQFARGTSGPAEDAVDNTGKRSTA